MFMQLWNSYPPEVQQKILDELSESLLVKHVAGPDETAEAYVFLMK